MQRLTIYPTSINSRHIATAVEALQEGEIIIYPTDSMYALGCDALSQKAVERLCSARGIAPAKQLLSIICSDLSMAAKYARIDNRAFQIMKRNAPGAFTFILPASSSLPKAFKGRKTVGIRIPDNPVAIALVEALGNPILSASLTGADNLPIGNADQIELLNLPYVEIMIDSGDGADSPSTVIDLTDSFSPEITRQGLGQLQ